MNFLDLSRKMMAHQNAILYRAEDAAITVGGDAVLKDLVSIGLKPSRDVRGSKHYSRRNLEKFVLLAEQTIWVGKPAPDLDQS